MTDDQDLPDLTEQQRSYASDCAVVDRDEDLDLASLDDEPEIEPWDDRHEQRDLHEADEAEDVQVDIERLQASFRPKVLREVPGMGRIYDFRNTGLLPPNGGRIHLQCWIEHIPVYPNKAGYDDFIGLAGVLRAQGLSLQTATDEVGNVALYNRYDVLCYQARGANQISGGTEHMHMSTGEKWNLRQLRASAWILNQVYNKHGLPVRMADLDAGPGNTVQVARTGHTSHQNEAAKAGYNDRSDPGKGYDWDYVRHCFLFYRQHLHFKGA
jgi:hypothetical protein